jgi:hypothetical protein
VRAKRIPAALCERPQWLVWRYSWDRAAKRKDTSGELGEWTKPPFSVRTGRKASSIDPETWVPFADALAAYQGGEYDGIGFVPLPEDGLVVIDLDRCRNPDTGEFDAWAAAIVADMDTYTEASPSGTGLRIVAYGRKPDRDRTKKGLVEIYDGETQDGKPGGRYLTFTGHRIEGAPADIRERQEALDTVYFRELKPRTEGKSLATDRPPERDKALDLDDDGIIAKAKAAKNGAKFNKLWAGDTSEYASPSEADLALAAMLAFWVGPDPERIDRLFRRSGRMRQKWLRADYRAGIIEKALEGKTEFYGSECGEEEPAGRKKTEAQRLVEMALGSGLALFHNPDLDGFASVPVQGHVETHKLRSKPFALWLRRLFYDAQHKPPGAQAVQDALGVLEGKAVFDGSSHPVAVRLAGHDGDLYLDLCDPDWRVVTVGPDGWRVVGSAPVTFRRAKAMLPLPAPVKGGSIADLRPFVNVANKDWPLLLGWLVAALRPTGPYPVLCLHGEQGSAKSTLARICRSLIDPNTAPVRAEPRDARDLAIAANNGWVVCLDNLSYMQPWMSDAFCRLSTGGGFSTRTLYENDEESIFDAMRPIIVNAVEEVVTRGDLLDRAVLITCPTIPDDQRRTEADLWGGFEAVRPSILGALLDAVSAGLRNLPRVQFDRLPRMADAVKWVTACEPGLGLKEGVFLRAYQRSQRTANETALDAAVVAAPLRRLMEQHEGEWTGSATELLEKLTSMVGEQTARAREWPKRAHVLSGKLRRLAPNLRKVGLFVAFGHTGQARTITLARENRGRER